jgi:hypothetical protein
VERGLGAGVLRCVLYRFSAGFPYKMTILLPSISMKSQILLGGCLASSTPAGSGAWADVETLSYQLVEQVPKLVYART